MGNKILEKGHVPITAFKDGTSNINQNVAVVILLGVPTKASPLRISKIASSTAKFGRS
jgi:hypothetical protein